MSLQHRCRRAAYVGRRFVTSVFQHVFPAIRRGTNVLLRREDGERLPNPRSPFPFREVYGAPTGDPEQALPNTLNIAIPGLDSEAVMLALKDLVAISNGSACTSQNYTASHVLTVMGLPEDHIKGALRLSWCHLTPEVRWGEVVGRIEGLS